jgi:hypothetical protein
VLLAKIGELLIHASARHFLRRVGRGNESWITGSHGRARIRGHSELHEQQNAQAKPRDQFSASSGHAFMLPRSGLSFIRGGWIPTENVRRRAIPQPNQFVRVVQPQPCCCWIGGHLTDPNEQNTQQSPAFGRSRVLHPTHS